MSKSLEEAREIALSYAIGPNRHERKCLGPLHQKLSTFLPEFVDKDEKFCNTTRLAMALGMTYAGVHRWMRPGRRNRITPDVAHKLVALSNLTKVKPDGFRPATIEDFWEFVIS